MSDDPAWVPDEVDVHLPSEARVYDYFLGGGHNFEADRRLAGKVLEVIPAREMAHANRSFVRRAVRYLVHEAGIRQFLDLGSGVPTVGNVHQVAQSASPDCTVVYVDHDPVAVAHSELMLGHNKNATAVRADLRFPETVLGHDDTRDLIDFREPAAVLMCAVLPVVGDDDNPTSVVEAYLAALCPGSALVISHASDDELPYDLAQAVALYNSAQIWTTPRTRDAITRLFNGLDLVPPGVVLVPHWHPDTSEDLDPHRSLTYGGVGIKPA